MSKHSKDDDSEYPNESRICCSVDTFLVSNYVWAVFSVGMAAIGVVGIVLNSGVFVVLPPQAYFAAVVFGAFGLCVLLCGVVGQKQRVEICFLVYVLLVSLGLIAQAVAFTYLLLYANDIGTLQSLDSAVIDAQKTFENNLVDYAQDQPSDWIQTQDKLGCCGIDFEIRINNVDIDPDVIETGKKCQDPDAKDAILALEDELDNGGAANVDKFGNFIPAFEDPVVGADTAFFCKFKISEVMQEQTPLIGSLIGLLLLVQLVALVSGARLYWVPEYMGGWMFDDEELEVIAETKHLKFPKRDENPNQGGNTVFNGLRQQANRLSFRIQNAYTADPNAPQGANFMQRLSLRNMRPPVPPVQPRMPSFEGQAGGGEMATGQMSTHRFSPEPPFNPPPTQSNRGMFGRVSQRLFAFGGGNNNMIDMGPPPGLQGGGRQPSNNQFKPAPPGAPPQLNLNVASRPSARTRISQRLVNGFNSFSAGFGGRRNAPPPGPPPGFGNDMNNGPPPPNMRGGYNSGPPEPPALPSFGSSRAMSGYDARSSNQSNNGFTPRMPVGGPPAPPSFGAMSPPAPPVMPSMAAPSFQPPPMTPSAPSFGQPGNSAPPAFNPSSAPVAAPRKPSNNNMMKKKSSNVLPKGRSTRAMGKKSSQQAKPANPMAGGGGARGGLLAQIQQGKRLNKAVTIDKSAPKI